MNVIARVEFELTYYNIVVQPVSHYTKIADPIYPTPPLGQDMTQGQFLSGV